MPRHDPTIAANDETAFENIETILLERDRNSGSRLFPYSGADFDRAMAMAHRLHGLVQRHSLKRRISGTRD